MNPCVVHNIREGLTLAMTTKRYVVNVRKLYQNVTIVIRLMRKKKKVILVQTLNTSKKKSLNKMSILHYMLEHRS